MRFYHTPVFIRKLYHSKAIWQIPVKEKIIFLSFDDGPTEELTHWILETLEKYEAKATFFCVGQNVEKHPGLFSEIRLKGHAPGNHTFNHLNGWKTDKDVYIQNVSMANKLIHSNLFRPPYGRMTKPQMTFLTRQGYKTVMWSLLTYDFDRELDKDKAWAKIVKYTRPGSILVFHDNIKASENLKVLLPKTLQYFRNIGYKFESLGRQNF